MTWLSVHRRRWAEAPRRLCVAGGVSVALAVFVFSMGIYFTTASRQARFTAATHYGYSKAVSDTVTEYTHCCDVLATSRNIRSLAELTSSRAPTASSLANQAVQDVWNVNTDISDDSSIAVYFPTIQLFVTKNQFNFSADFSRIFSISYPGLSYEDVLSRSTGSWYSYCSDGFCYIVRSLQAGTQAVAYIVAKFPADVIFSGEVRSIAVIGDDSNCLYASKDNLPENLYSDLLLSLSSDRHIFIGGVRYYVIRNEFSCLSLRFFTLVPALTGAILAIRLTSWILFLVLLGAPELMLLSFSKRQATEREAVPMTPQGAQATDSAGHYTLSGLTKTLLDLPQERDFRISQQCYKLLKLSAKEDCVVMGFVLLEDQERLFDNAKNANGSCRPITPYFILNNMLQDLLYDRHIGCLCYCGNKYIAFSNLLPGETEEDFRVITDRVAASAKTYLYLTFVGSEPTVCHGYEHFYATLRQTSQKLDHARLWWRTEKLPSMDTQEQSSADFYNRLGLLNACILENNYIKAEETFHAILQNCIPTHVNQVKEAESRLAMLFESLLSLTGYPREQLPANAVSPKNIAACKEAGEQIFRAQITAQSFACTNPAKDRIRVISEYVRDNYADPALGVGAIAIRFGMNAAYLSRVFKDSTGTNLLEYIHRTRITAAKKLLPDYSIKEVGPMVGFADVQSFVRTFRKYEVISPSEYKRNCTPSNNSLPK